MQTNNATILCRTCAAYGSCKLAKKGTATKCLKFWEHRPTSDFTGPRTPGVDSGTA